MLKITIGVPIWNQKLRYFRECLESIKAQTCQDFECIILDDGSDNKEEVEKITKEFGFKYIYQKIQGIGAARQVIVNNASKETEFIVFLSSDDVWDEKFLEIMIKTAKQQPNKILYSNYYFIDKDSKIKGAIRISNFNDSYEDFCIAAWEAAERNTMFTNISCFFIPKKVFEKVKFDNYRFGEDLDFLLKSMKHFQYYFVKDYLLKYRETGMTHKIIDKIPENNIKIRKNCMEYWNENNNC